MFVMLTGPSWSFADPYGVSTTAALEPEVGAHDCPAMRLAVRPQYGRARAKAFNVGESQRQTGVRFADVAGIDVIKDEVRVVMDMLLGAKEYKDIGAQPFRVCASGVLSSPTRLGCVSIGAFG